MEAMQNDPLFQYKQQAEDEERELYLRRSRIVTAYDLDASQIRDYLQQRLEQL